MRIPLDYYQILGLPIQTSAEQLLQAYRDRTLQLPQREYSQAAIEARNQLIAAAYTFLSDPEQRQRYDASYFTFTYEQEANSVVPVAREHLEPDLDGFEPNTPSIEIADEQFVGALLILQELGEYELVLDLGRASLSTNILPESERAGESYAPRRSDIVLTLALAYLELGREQWQQGQYENAAFSLESGQNLLSRERLFPNVAAQLKADLDKLRPYRILELLAQPEGNVVQRQQGMELLQDILQERSGIDGTGDDGSGLSVEDFLRFIQQLRSYLTAAEQQSLFEAESQRPCAVATYLTVYALIARGFAQRIPVLICQAKLMLMRLGKRQDLYLEQAICSLLLGQTTEASRALELSQEYEPIAFIRENSQGSPDLLPGLCLYSESWLQNEVFPHFRDLAQQGTSLKEYFADKQVQTYLEALPTHLEATDEWTEESERESQLFSTPANYSYHSEQAQATSSLSASALEQPDRKPTTRTARSKERRAKPFTKDRGRGTRYEEQSNQLPVETTHRDVSTRQSPAVSGVAVLPDTERIAKPTTNQNPTDSVLSQVTAYPQRSRRRTRNRGFRQANGRDHGETAIGIVAAKKNRLVLLLVGGILGLGVLGFLASHVLRQIFSPAPLEAEPLMVQLNQPTVPIPVPAKSKQPPVAEPLNQVTAKLVIENWLSTKSAAFGQDRAVEKLEGILVEPALSQWQKRVQIDKASNRTRQYKHSVKVNGVQTVASASDRAKVEATVNEAAQVYEKGRLNPAGSYNESLRVQYDLVRQGDRWRIKAMKVLK